MRWLATFASLLTLAAATPGAAEDDPPERRGGSEPGSLWQGFYLGGHVGGFVGTTYFFDPDGNDLFGGSVSTPGFLVGLQAGYNWLLTSQWLAGVELSGSYLTSQGYNTCFQSSAERIGSNCTVYPSQLATLAGRAGYLATADRRTLLYGKAGLAWMHSLVSVAPNGIAAFPQAETGSPLIQSISAWGWTVGAGLERVLSPRWSLDVGYNYVGFNGLSVSTPQTINGTLTGVVSSVPVGRAGASQNLHIARVGLNYHLGAGSAASLGSSDVSEEQPGYGAWVPNWEVEMGARYWYSVGNFQTVTGSPVISRLSYNGMAGHSGEVFARLDSPYNVFAKGLFGGGFIVNGTHYDEDWGLENTSIAYETTQSSVQGSFNYLMIDVGYDVLRGPDHKVGAFVGYNRYRTLMNAYGCFQIANPESDICTVPAPPAQLGVSEDDTWNSMRLGVSADVQLSDRFGINLDLAYLPYVYVDSLDTHWQRQPPLLFRTYGSGNGFQGELIVSYRVTKAFNMGIGGRYWSMWTNNTWSWPLGPLSASGVTSLNTERYGVFVQASYQFGKP